MSDEPQQPQTSATPLPCLPVARRKLQARHGNVRRADRDVVRPGGVDVARTAVPLLSLLALRSPLALLPLKPPLALCSRRPLLPLGSLRPHGPLLSLGTGGSLLPPRSFALSPSTRSALRSFTLALEPTFVGGWPSPTSSLRAGPGPLLTSVLTASATLDFPSTNGLPFAPRAVVATPNTKASITASPAIKTVARPTHITFRYSETSIEEVRSRAHPSYGLGLLVRWSENFLEPPQGEVRAAPYRAAPLARLEVFGPLCAELERQAGEGFSRGVAAEPRPLLFSDPGSGFYPRFPLRRRRNGVLGFREGASRVHDPILAQVARSRPVGACQGGR